MPNLVEPDHQIVLARYPDALIIDRRRHSLFHYSANANLIIQDYNIGSYHFNDGGLFREINTDLVNSDDGNFTDMNNVAPYKFYSGGNSQKRLYPRRDHLTEYVEFSRPQYWTGSAWSNLTLGSRVRSGNILTWDRPAFSLQIVLSGDGIGKTIVLKNSSAARRVGWPITLTGLTWSNWQLISIADGTPVANVSRPRMTDANGTVGAITCDYVNGRVEFTADVTGLVYPITIDPTVDVTVAASADDATERPWGEMEVSSANFNQLRNDSYWYWGMRWPLAIAQGVTIGANTYASVYVFSSSIDDPDCAIYCQAADTAAAFAATDYNISSRTRTTDHTHWTATGVGSGYINTPSLTAPIQEVINRAAWASLNYLATIWQALGNTQFINAYQYDQGPGTYPPKLHVEYTAAGGTTYEGSITLAKSHGITEGAQLDAFNSIALAKAAGVAEGNLMEAVNTLTLGKIHTVTASSLADLLNSIILGRSAGASLANILTAENAVTLAIIKGLTTIGGLNLTDAIALGRLHGVSTANIVTKEEAIALGKVLGLAAAATLDAADGMTLAKALGISIASGAELYNTITLAKSLAAAISGGMTYENSISLAIIFGTTMAGTVVVISAATPEERIYLIDAENRIYEIKLEERTYKIPGDNRTYRIGA
jgi:hypothetical protein